MRRLSRQLRYAMDRFPADALWAASDWALDRVVNRIRARMPDEVQAAVSRVLERWLPEAEEAEEAGTGTGARAPASAGAGRTASSSDSDPTRAGQRAPKAETGRADAPFASAERATREIKGAPEEAANSLSSDHSSSDRSSSDRSAPKPATQKKPNARKKPAARKRPAAGATTTQIEAIGARDTGSGRTQAEVTATGKTPAIRGRKAPAAKAKPAAKSGSARGRRVSAKAVDNAARTKQSQGS